MAIPTSGQISFGDFLNEFGGGTPVYFSQMYRGGPRVPNNSANQGVPTSGTLYLSQFRGAAASVGSPLSVTAPNVSRVVNSGTATGSSVASASGGSGGYTYTWTNGTPGANFSSNGATATWSSPSSRSGTGTVTVRDSSGATASYQIYVDLTVGRPV